MSSQHSSIGPDIGLVQTVEFRMPRNLAEAGCGVYGCEQRGVQRLFVGGGNGGHTSHTVIGFCLEHLIALALAADACTSEVSRG